MEKIKMPALLAPDPHTVETKRAILVGPNSLNTTLHHLILFIKIRIKRAILVGPNSLNSILHHLITCSLFWRYSLFS